jgi:hypothetical protein
MSGYEVRPETLDAVAGILRNASDEVASVGEPPDVPNVGIVSGLVAAVAAHLAEQTVTLTATLDGTADAVDAGGRSYVEAEEAARDALPKPGPQPI